MEQSQKKVIKWIDVEHRQWKAEPEPGVLMRIEDMGKSFWFCLYYHDRHYDSFFIIPTAKTLEEAKEQCEKKYLQIKNVSQSDAITTPESKEDSVGLAIQEKKGRKTQYCCDITSDNSL